MQNDTLAAVDIAREAFDEVGVSDRPGHVARRRRLARYEFLEFLAQLPPATVVMEACGSAHFWARRIEELGHVVVLLPPQYVRPYVVRNKTDRQDVDGLLEAFRNDRIKQVPIKSVTQQVLGTLHRLRSGCLADRTRAINALRGLLRELGFFFPEGRKHVLPEAWDDALRFPSGRHMASFLGLTPREYSTVLHRRLGRISKRGDVYLRMLLIHGARSILWPSVPTNRYSSVLSEPRPCLWR